MSEYLIAVAGFLLIAYALFDAGRFDGKASTRRLLEPEAQRAARYARAVDDLDRWCGHSSESARVIAIHLRAHGEGEHLNAGSPVADEPCTIIGLREQLRRIDAQQREVRHD